MHRRWFGPIAAVALAALLVGVGAVSRGSGKPAQPPRPIVADASVRGVGDESADTMRRMQRRLQMRTVP